MPGQVRRTKKPAGQLGRGSIRAHSPTLAENYSRSCKVCKGKNSLYTIFFAIRRDAAGGSEAGKGQGHYRPDAGKRVLGDLDGKRRVGVLERHDPPGRRHLGGGVLRQHAADQQVAQGGGQHAGPGDVIVLEERPVLGRMFGDGGAKPIEVRIDRRPVGRIVRVGLLAASSNYGRQMERLGAGPVPSSEAGHVPSAADIPYQEVEIHRRMKSHGTNQKGQAKIFSHDANANTALFTTVIHIISPVRSNVVITKGPLRIVIQVSVDECTRKRCNDKRREHKVNL